MRIFCSLSGQFLALAFATILSSHAIAACDNNALGTSRTISVDASKSPHFEGMEASLGLRDKEVILTFDDGPIAGKTSRILDALEKECVKATFFYVGRMAKYQPEMVRRVIAQGHTLGHHTHDHNRLTKYSIGKASKLIDQGISTLQQIAYGDDSAVPRVPFFRYPYLASTSGTDRMLRQKGLVSFGANIDSFDWKKNSAEQVHDRIMHKLKKAGKGIILMHDIQARTAKMLPGLLRSLKQEGYRVVHMVPGTNREPAEEPIVVASVDIKGTFEQPLPELAQTAPQHKVQEKETESNDTTEQQSPQIAQDPTGSDVGAAQQMAEKPKPSPRTGVVLAALSPEISRVVQETIIETGTAADASGDQPEVDRADENASPKPSTRTAKSKTRSKRRLATRNNKARNDRIQTGTWKLRRSQWILR